MIRREGDIDKIQKLGINTEDAMQLMLAKIGLTVQNTSKKLAPYMTGILRKSIGTDFNYIKKGMVVVGSNVAYARKREYENKKNPQTKYYLLRGYTTNRAKIKAIIIKSLQEKLK